MSLVEVICLRATARLWVTFDASEEVSVVPAVRIPLTESLTGVMKLRRCLSFFCPESGDAISNNYDKHFQPRGYGSGWRIVRTS